MRQSSNSNRRLVVELAADLTQVAYLEVDGRRIPLTAVPKGFRARHVAAISSGRVDVDGSERRVKDEF